MRRVPPALLFLLLLCASLRLCGEVRVRGANFTYDGAGNRIKELLNTATVPTSTTAANITAAQFASLYANEIDYGYDDLNRLANVTLNGNYIETGVESSLMESLTYRYDYQNRRALRLDDQTAWPTAEAQQVWQEVYDGPGPVRDEYASYAGGWTLGIQADYMRGSDWGGGIGGVLYAQTLSGNANTAKYYNYDGRGDVVALTSNTGNVTYAAAYNAYGQHATVTAGNVTTTGTQEVGTDTDLFRLTTKEEDPFGGMYDTNRELGLNDNNWFQRDPAGMVNGPNPYTYVEQNNWTKFDPLGEWGDTYGEMDDSAQSTYGSGGFWGTVRSFGVQLAKNTLNTLTAGGFRANSQIAENVGEGKENAWDGAGQMAHNMGTFAAKTAVAEAGGTVIKGVAQGWTDAGGAAAGSVVKGGTSAPVADAPVSPTPVKSSPPEAPATNSPAAIKDSVSGVADDSLVHFAPQDRGAVINPSEDGNVYAFKYGDIKNLTPKQTEFAIGPLAQGGEPGGASYMHVLDVDPKMAKIDTRPIPEYTIQGQVPVKQTFQVQPPQ